MLFGECRETLWLLRENIPNVFSDQSQTNSQKTHQRGIALPGKKRLPPEDTQPCTFLLRQQPSRDSVQDCDLQFGIIITFPNAVLAWVSNPFSPLSPSQQHLVSHLHYSAASRELHSVGHVAIQIQVNISFFMNKPPQSCCENKVCDFGVKNLDWESKTNSLSLVDATHLLFLDSQPFVLIPSSTKTYKTLTAWCSPKLNAL